MGFVVHHGDCIEIMASMDAESVDAVVTDPPYSSGGCFRGDRMQRVDVKYVQTGTNSCRAPFSGDTMDQRSLFAFSTLWMTNARRIVKPGGVIVVFTDWRQLPLFSDAIQAGGFVWRNIGTWWKPGVRMQKGRFSSSAEYVIYGTAGVPADGARSPQNVFSCKCVRGQDKLHICQKPVEVMQWVLGLVPSGSLVLDPFCGSGSTGEAAMLEGLRFIGIEREAEYVKIARARIAAVAADRPLLEATA